MCSVLKECVDEGRAEGRVEGRAEGMAVAILNLISDNTISINKGADALGISVEEMYRKYAEYKANGNRL